MADDKHKPEEYVKALNFIRKLGRERRRLTTQQMRTLRGQALNGDIDGAMRGLGMLLLKYQEGNR